MMDMRKSVVAGRCSATVAAAAVIDSTEGMMKFPAAFWTMPRGNKCG